MPQSLRQQELVCLTSGHVNCPRYLRGAMTVAKPLDRVPAARIVTPAIAGSVLALIGAFLLSVAFVVANGGLTLTAAAPAGPTGAVLGEVETAAPTATSAAATPLATATAAATAAPTPSPTPAASPTSHAEPDRVAEPHVQSGHHRHPGTDAEADGQAVLEPVRAAQAVLGHARLLHLRDPLGRQPVQHRQLLRGVLEDGQGLEPLDG